MAADIVPDRGGKLHTKRLVQIARRSHHIHLSVDQLGTFAFGDCYNYETERPTISARDLHEALGISSRFSRWFDTNKELFVEGEDYNKCTSSTFVNNGARRELEDYAITVLMAKHLCLMSRTEKGKQCRQYLINLEKAWNTPEQIFARALKMADQKIEKLKESNAGLIVGSLLLSVEKSADDGRLIFCLRPQTFM